MKTVTRCPGCHTSFFVQRDQLEAREGRVRCGACGTVFDARVSLEVLEGAEATPSNPPGEGEELFEEAQPVVLDMGPLPVSEAVVTSLDDETPAGAHADDATLVMPRGPGTARAPEPPSDADHMEKEPLFVEEQAEDDAAAPSAEDDAAVTPSAPSSLAPALVALTPADAAGATMHGAAEAVTGRLQPPAAEAGAFGEGEPLPDFDAERREQRRLTRTWALACVPVALLLAIQAALHWRAELGALAPGMRGLLAVLCAPFGCEVGLPQHPNLLALEGANLEADASGGLILYATLRNRARYEQSLPAIELTLTDPREQPVARRLLTPRDYAPGRGEGIAPGGEIFVKVAIDATATRASGFRAEAVYPAP
jgi:predicted Zn finger-like uncharacterized protein